MPSGSMSGMPMPQPSASKLPEAEMPAASGVQSGMASGSAAMPEPSAAPEEESSEECAGEFALELSYMNGALIIPDHIT